MMRGFRVPFDGRALVGDRRQIPVRPDGLVIGQHDQGLCDRRRDEVALVVAVVYRIATFYLPPVWGFFAMRWLTATDRL